MKWLTVAVESSFGWPVKETEIEYLGEKYLLRPESDDEPQSVSLRCPAGMTMVAGRLLVNRFLSALSWVEGHGIIEIFSVGSNGPKPVKVGKGKTRFISKNFRADYLPEPNDDKSRRALALYREAQSLNSATYSFLGFFKVLNVLFKNGKEQKAWVNSNLGFASGYKASKRLLELRELHKDIGEYLYVQGRCAVAHAFSDPAIDPDVPEDVERLTADLPLIEELSTIAIERELGIISKSTFLAVHLYELAGFERIIGQDIVSCLKEGETLDQGIEIDIPPLSLRLRDHVQFASFEDLQPVSLQQCANALIIRLHSPDDIVQLAITLDFKQWRLRFDPSEDVIILDDGSRRPMLARSDAALLTKGVCANGQVEIYNTETNELLARTDPYIPHNIDLRATLVNLDKISSEALDEAQRRGSTSGEPVDLPSANNQTGKVMDSGQTEKRA